jgi:transcriptional regulator with XRE-family HTH domain
MGRVRRDDDRHGDDPRGADQVGTERTSLAAEVRGRRTARGLSRADLARLTGYSATYLGQLEQPGRPVPARPVVAAVDRALGAQGALVRLREAALAARDAEPLAGSAGPLAGSENSSRRRIRGLLEQRTSEERLDRFDRRVAELVDAAGRLAPTVVAARVVEEQRAADILLASRLLPDQQVRLFVLSGHLAGLLALALVDAGEMRAASVSCLEAAVFTELTGHEGLRAWTLAINGLIETATRIYGTTPRPGMAPGAAPLEPAPPFPVPPARPAPTHPLPPADQPFGAHDAGFDAWPEPGDLESLDPLGAVPDLEAVPDLGAWVGEDDAHQSAAMLHPRFTPFATAWMRRRQPSDRAPTFIPPV